MVKSLAIRQVHSYPLLIRSGYIDKTGHFNPIYPCVGVKVTNMKSVRVLVQLLLSFEQLDSQCKNHKCLAQLLH